MKNLFLLLLLCFIALETIAQKKNESFQYHIRKTDLPIVIDGLEDDDAWQHTDVATNFFMVTPMDTSAAQVRTDVRMTYDNKNLYLIALCYHAVPGPYFVQSLRRDFVFGRNDNFLLFMDPFDNQTTGFSFGVNAAGAQWDGTMYAGGAVDLSWDNKWVSEVTYDDEKWVFEMAIPFTTIRYKKGITRWGINFSRLDLKTTEKSSWAPVPRQFPSAALAYAGVLVWDEPPPGTGPNISVIPYALGGITKDHEENTATGYQNKFGADVKVGLTSSLNLDLTFNPDFSQVEVDRQVTNLDRFELLFPERRQFFLENGDLFGNFGYTTIRPFFSRRIGLGVPIRAGARISGNINKDWRVGLMDMQTASVKETGLPDQNFAVVSLQRRVFSRSNIALLFVNKESVNYQPERDTIHPAYSMYNRNIGVEYNLASANNIWNGKALFLKSFSPERSGDDMVQAANIEYKSRRWNIAAQQEYVGRNYRAEVGYVPRTGFFKLNGLVQHLFFPKSRKILTHGPRVASTIFYQKNSFATDESFHRTDNISSAGYSVTWRNLNSLTFTLTDEFVELFLPFDPTNSGKDTLARGTRHHWNSWRAEFVSKPQSVFTYSLTASNGTYYANGNRFNVAGEAGFRLQPYVSILVSANYNQLRLPEPWNETTFWLIGSQLDITMTNTLFFSTFFQYNEQLNNINLNSRFQWRYKPASDLFIVYTDNYLPEPFSVRNRAVVLKLTYWWNR